MKGRYDYNRGYIDNPSRNWLRDRQEARANAHPVINRIAIGLGYALMAAIVLSDQIHQAINYLIK